MKTVAALALLGLVAASEDSEFFVHHNQTNSELFVHHNQTHHAKVRAEPTFKLPVLNHNKTQNATVKPKPNRPVHPILFNRTHPVHPKNKEWLNSKGPKALIKILSSYDDDELWNVDNVQANDDELHFNLISKVGSYVGRNPSTVIPIASKIFGKFDDSVDSELAFSDYISKGKNVIGKLAGNLDDEADYELNSNVVSKVGGYITKGKNIVGPVLGKLAGNLDDEFTADELAFLGSFTRVVQKATPNTVGKKAVPFIALDDISEEELFNLDAFLNDAVRTYNDARQTPRNYGNLVNDGIQLIKDIKQKKDDEELFHLPGFINDGNYIRKHDEEQDDELVNLDALLNDAIKTYNDARQNPRNYGDLVNDGIQIVKDLKQKKADDEELFNLGGLINDGLNIYKDVKTHNYGGLVNDGIQTVKDVKKNLRHH